MKLLARSWLATLYRNDVPVLRQTVPTIGATFERALHYRTGIFIEHYRVTEITADHEARATFVKLTRSNQLEPKPRDPERLPA